MSDKSNTPPKQRMLLIDADVLIFQAAAGCEKVICFEEDTCFPVCSLADARAAFDFKMEFIKKTLGVTDNSNIFLCFSGNAGENFRKAIDPQYKSNRVGKARPMALKFLKEQLLTDGAYPVFMENNLEADDLLGISATTPTPYDDYEKVIVTIDKDLKGVPCSFYNIGKPEDGVVVIDEQEADWWFFIQALKGDPTDGYGGCPKIGDKTALKLLEDVDKNPKDLWEAVVKAYEKAGLSEDYALTQARLARILRNGEYDFKTKQVKLWQPTK